MCFTHFWAARKSPSQDNYKLFTWHISRIFFSPQENNYHFHNHNSFSSYFLRVLTIIILLFTSGHAVIFCNSNNHFSYITITTFSQLNYNSFHQRGHCIADLSTKRTLIGVALILRDILSRLLLETHSKCLKLTALWFLITKHHPASPVLANIRDCPVLSLGSLSSPPIRYCSIRFDL